MESLSTSSEQATSVDVAPAKTTVSAKRRKMKRRSLSVNMVIMRENPRVATNKQTITKLNNTKNTRCFEPKEDINFTTNIDKTDKGILPRRKGDPPKRKRSMSVQNLPNYSTNHTTMNKSFIEDLENVEIDPSLMIYFRFPPDVQELVGKYLSMQKNAFSLSRKKENKQAWENGNISGELTKLSTSKTSTPRHVKQPPSETQLSTKPSFGSILQARSLVKKWVLRAGKDRQKLPPINDIDAGIALELKTRCTPVFAQALKSLGYDARGEKTHGDMKLLKDFTPVSKIIMNLTENGKREKGEK